MYIHNSQLKTTCSEFTHTMLVTGVLTKTWVTQDRLVSQLLQKGVAQDWLVSQ